MNCSTAVSYTHLVEVLLERTLKKGGRDNATIILCEVREKEKNWLQKLIDKLYKRYEGE